MRAALIPWHVFPFGGDVADVRYLGVIQLGDQTFADIDGNIVGRWHDQIETRTACLDLGEGGCVAVIVSDRDSNTGLRGELFDHFGAGIVTPVKEVQLPFGIGTDCAAYQSCGRD